MTVARREPDPSPDRKRRGEPTPPARAPRRVSDVYAGDPARAEARREADALYAVAARLRSPLSSLTRHPPTPAELADLLERCAAEAERVAARLDPG